MDDAYFMNRAAGIAQLEEKSKRWDIIVIGGGATGLGVALDAASRGYTALLVERGDFAQGTSSRSTKLIHGGVRYLRQGNLALIVDALRERGRLRRNAPHLVFDLPFVVPNYDWWEGPFYGIGLKIYDMLAGKEGFGKSEILAREKVLQHIPTVETRGLRSGVIYHDGQFDDARLAVNLAQTAWEQGAVLLNYVETVRLTQKGGFTDGVVVRDGETDREYPLKAKAVVNATGPFCDAIRKLDDPDALPMIRPSQGVHIVIDKAFLPGDSAIMVPHTDDGRVLFAVPWQDCIIVGTTDTPLEAVHAEPIPLSEEIDFLLSHASRYLEKDPKQEDILSMFAGIRPLVGNDASGETATLSRDHVLSISRTGLVTITGGKWTTYRKMAEETVDHAAVIGQLDSRPCVTQRLKIHGYHENTQGLGNLALYGADAIPLRMFIKKDAARQEKIHPASDVCVGEVLWAVRNEMARTVEDFLSRRRRVLIRDARTSMEAAPRVAEIMARVLEKDAAWCAEQTRRYLDLARTYLP